jgi:hypothetical protein
MTVSTRCFVMEYTSTERLLNRRCESDCVGNYEYFGTLWRDEQFPIEYVSIKYGACALWTHPGEQRKVDNLAKILDVDDPNT